MKSSELTQRVNFLVTPEISFNALGDMEGQEVSFYECYAKVKPTSGYRRLQVAETINGALYTVTIRQPHLLNITENMIISWNKQRLTIKFIEEDLHLKQWLHITAVTNKNILGKEPVTELSGAAQGETEILLNWKTPQ